MEGKSRDGKRRRAVRKGRPRTGIAAGPGKKNSAPLTNLPRGIEVLLKKASIDPEFKTLLLGKREEAAKSIGLELEPSEIMLLNSIPDEQLKTIIENTWVSPETRRAFLGRVATLMLAALGGLVLESCTAGDPGHNNDPPTAAFVYTPLDPQVDETVQFTDHSYDIDGIITSWSWTFTDGTPATSTEQNPACVFNSSGYHAVTLIVTDNDGRTGSVTQLVTVS